MNAKRSWKFRRKTSLPSCSIREVWITKTGVYIRRRLNPIRKRRQLIRIFLRRKRVHRLQRKRNRSLVQLPLPPPLQMIQNHLNRARLTRSNRIKNRDSSQPVQPGQRQNHQQPAEPRHSAMFRPPRLRRQVLLEEAVKETLLMTVSAISSATSITQ